MLQSMGSQRVRHSWATEQQYNYNMGFSSGSPVRICLQCRRPGLDLWIGKTQFPLVLTGLISLRSKGLSRVFYSTTIQQHQLETILFISSTYILQSHSKNWIKRILNHFSKGNRGSGSCEPLVTTFLSISQYKNHVLCVFLFKDTIKHYKSLQ